MLFRSPTTSAATAVPRNRRSEGRPGPAPSSARRPVPHTRGIAPGPGRPLAPGSLLLGNGLSARAGRSARRRAGGNFSGEEEPAAPSLRGAPGEEIPAGTTSETVARVHIPIISEGTGITEEELEIDLALLMPEDCGKPPCASPAAARKAGRWKKKIARCLG